MVRILQVFASLNIGGAESRMMDVFRSIDRNKYTFDFLTMQLDEQYFEAEIAALGGKVIKIASPRDCGIRRNLKALIRVMKEGKYDAVHAHTSYHCGLVMLAAKIAKIPVRISHSRTAGSKQSGTKIKLMLKIGRFLINRYATCRFAISKEAGAYLFRNKNYTLLPNAIDLTHYKHRDEDAVKKLKEDFGLKDAEMILGQVGRFDHVKNHGFTLKLFHTYLKKHPTAKLVLIGNGPMSLQREQEAKSLGIFENVVFTGIRSDIPNWMFLFDALLVPSVYEGLGGVILEAQAAGTHVLKSDSFTDEADMKIGLVRRCKFNDLDDWLSALESLSSEPRGETFGVHNDYLSEAISVLCEAYENH